MISYKPLLKFLIDNNLSKGDILKGTNISSRTLAKLNTNSYVSLDVIDKICIYLNKELKINIKICDVIEFISKE